jgi:photosystem II stability/assembly factor-like uncharacterized protein
MSASGSNLYVGAGDNAVFVSTNNGTTWDLTNSGLKRIHVNSLVARGMDIYVGTWNGVYCSTDAGKSWAPINAGLTNLQVTTLYVRGTYLFAGTGGGGVFRSRLSEMIPGGK